MHDPLRDPPTAFGPAPGRGVLRRTAEDFRVDEYLGFEPDGQGAHLLLHVEKRGANTGWVAAQLARLAGVPPREIGFCGHKDRHAVTRQWFSVPWPLRRPEEEARSFAGEGFVVSDARRHGRKLRPGAHRGNRFEIRVHELAADPLALEARLEQVAARGVPNYFGPQRFGRGGANLLRALRWADSGSAPAGRAERGFALSAARGALFNRVLGARVLASHWDALLPGEAVLLDGTQSFFATNEIDATLQERLQRGDLHPSGPLHGRGSSPATGAALAVEEQALSDCGPLRALLEAEGLAQERRALRLRPTDFEWAVESECLVLRFGLPRGAFATAVLHEVLSEAWLAETGSDD